MGSDASESAADRLYHDTVAFFAERGLHVQEWEFTSRECRARNPATGTRVGAPAVRQRLRIEVEDEEGNRARFDLS